MTQVQVSAHPGQIDVLTSDARFKVLACGRRWGKTTVCILRTVQELAQGSPLVWWVAPVYDQAEIGFRKFLETFPEEAIETVHRSRRSVQTTFGGRIEFKSADNPDRLRGEGVDLLVIDEAPEIAEYAWQNALRPTMTDTKESEMLAIGTPKGRNWFYRMFKRAQNADEEAYQTWNLGPERGRPTTDNPFISADDVEQAKDTMPDRVFRQEWQAHFISDAGGVFDSPRERIVQEYDWREFDGAAPYTTGVDFARHQDWTVILTLDADRKLVHFDRVQKVTWDEIHGRVVSTYEQYPGPVRVDASRDNKIVEDLRNDGVQVEPVKFNNQSKKQMVENLATLNEGARLTIPQIPTLINELELFEYDVSRQGTVRYHAPSGHHDDCVDALAMAAKTNRSRTSSDTLILKS